MKDELSGKIMTKFVGPRGKIYSYLIDDGSKDKKAKGRKKCLIKRKLKFENYENCLEAKQLEVYQKIGGLEVYQKIVSQLTKKTGQLKLFKMPRNIYFDKYLKWSSSGVPFS